MASELVVIRGGSIDFGTQRSGRARDSPTPFAPICQIAFSDMQNLCLPIQAISRREMNDKRTEQNVPNQRDRIAVVTGANTGLGYRAAQVLAEKGASVVLAVRDIAKGKDAAARIAQTAPRADLTVLHLDLTSLASVHDATAELHQQCSKI